MNRAANRWIGYAISLSLTPLLALGLAAAQDSASAAAPASSESGTAPAAPGSGAAPDASAPAALAASPEQALAPAPKSGVVPRVALAPPPTTGRVEGLQILREHAADYERSARAYQRLLDQIVRHHFEERRRRLVRSLSQEIDGEQEALLRAREEAIARLEEFIARYSGSNADPRATPDAMLRLAALYEERARGGDDPDLGKALEPAIALYERIAREFPAYEELAAAAYYHGHALTDAGRLEEGQAVWRSLVCQSRFPLGGPATLPQDHDSVFWDQWYNRHPIPLDQMARYSSAQLSAPGAASEELRFIDPYAGCVPIAQKTPEGEEPRYLAEIWWQLGNFHFDQLDPGGPYSFNRALAAYEHSLQFQKPPLYGVAMYKRAWTHFKQQRYRTAVDWFVKLLHYADAEEARTGDPGADFRQEAFTYIAGSLTYVDFDGPPPEDPFIPRSDVLDVELDPVAAERKMSVAITRVQDPSLIPQDKPWTVDIYRALGQEFVDITQNRNAIQVLQLALQKFPLHKTAPETQARVAALFDQLAQLAPSGSAAQKEYAALALEARTGLAAYVGQTAWTQANQDDPVAIEQAEALAREGLQRAAADHTNRARALLAQAQASGEASEQRLLLERTIDEYKSAEVAWGAYIAQDPTAVDGYESRFWLADARYFGVVLSLTLGRPPSTAEVDAARGAIVDIRDSNEDDRFLQPSAYYLVSLSDNLLGAAYREYGASGGLRGLMQREEVEFADVGGVRKVVQVPMPEPIVATVQARDEYNERVKLEQDPQKNGPLYSFQAADAFFVYGQFEQAEVRFQTLMDEHCGKNEWGYRAWEKLISMSNFQGNAERSRALAEGRSCAFDEETRAAEDALRTPVRQGVAYLEARALYDAAEKMPPGPERDQAWRKTAAAYRVALDAAPDRDEAPEAAMNGAYAYKQVGEYDKAIAMYELFISRYGDEDKLALLAKGDPKAKPPVPPDPERYAQRTGYVKSALDALASSYVLFFDYRAAANVFDRVSRGEHFDVEERREAARQLLTLSASLDDQALMQKARGRLAALGAVPEQLAEADFTAASAALKSWDPNSPDTGENRRARLEAERQMRRYHDEQKRAPAANPFVVEAAYWVARSKTASADAEAPRWWQWTQEAFERFRQTAPVGSDGRSSALGSRQAGFAAEGAYRQLDQQVRQGFDYETGHHRFAGTTAEVIAQYHKAAQDAQRYSDGLQRIVDAYASPEWATAALARQGSLYDSLRTGLYNTTPPALKMFDARTDALLRRAENSDNLELQEQADAVRMRVETAWREARDLELSSTDEVMVARYGTAIMLARRYNVSQPAVTRAIARLAFFTEIIGDGKLAQYTANVPGLTYEPGLFVRLRPGLSTAPSAALDVPPAPGALP